MHRRSRHLNPASAGAFSAYDARFLTGLADGASVSTWSDRTPNARDVTQSTPANQPTYETNELNGNPVVRFDGSTDVLTVTFSSTSVQYAVLVGKQNSTAAQFRRFFDLHSSGTTRLTFFRDAADYQMGAFATSFGPRNITFSGYNIATCGGTSGTLRATVNGVLSSTSGSYNYSANQLNVGSGLSASGPYPLPCDIAMLTFFASDLDAPLRRRLEQSAGFSFKLQCS